MTRYALAIEPMFVFLWATVMCSDPSSSDNEDQMDETQDSGEIYISGEGYSFRWRRPPGATEESEYVPLATSSRLIDLRASPEVIDSEAHSGDDVSNGNDTNRPSY